MPVVAVLVALGSVVVLTRAGAPSQGRQRRCSWSWNVPTWQNPFVPGNCRGR